MRKRRNLIRTLWCFPMERSWSDTLRALPEALAKFKSDTLGEITIDLSKVQELHTSEKFAVIAKKYKPRQG